MTYAATIIIYESKPGGQLIELNVLKTQYRKTLHDVYLECGVLVFDYIKEFGDVVKYYETQGSGYFFMLQLFKRNDSTKALWLYKVLSKPNAPECFPKILSVCDYLYRFILKLASKHKSKVTDG